VPGLTLPARPNDSAGPLYYAIRVNAERFGCSRDELQRRLRELNVFTRKYFYPLCSDYPCYRHLPSADPSSLPVARKAADQVLCLPLHAGVEPEQARTIGLMIRAFAAPVIVAAGLTAVNSIG
jgi:dTDP-4-amino-4,6-dideoxygalactose transaminase